MSKVRMAHQRDLSCGGPSARLPSSHGAAQPFHLEQIRSSPEAFKDGSGGSEIQIRFVRIAQLAACASDEDPSASHLVGRPYLLPNRLRLMERSERSSGIAFH